MASSDSSCSLGDGLLCPVCCEQIKTPKILPCGHSFCLEPCLRELLEAAHACPLCRKDIQAPPSGLADDFLTNFALHALVSTNVTSTTEESESPPSDTSDDCKTNCGLHQRQGEYFCESCVKYLCDECNESHEDGHEIEELNTVSERRISELEPLMGGIANSLKIIKETIESVKDAKVKCEESCQQAESEICDAVSSLTDLLQEKGKKLVIEAVKGREAGIKTLNKLEVQLGDAEVTAKRMEGLATSLMARFRKNDIRDTGVFAALMTQQKKMNTELANIRGPPEKTVLVKFQSNVWFSTPLGKVNVVTDAGNQPNQPKDSAKTSFGGSGFSFGTPATTTTTAATGSPFSFGSAAASGGTRPALGGFSFGGDATTSSSIGLSIGQPSTGLSFGQPSSAAPASTAASGLSFGSTTAQPAAALTAGGFSFGGGASGGASGFSLSTAKPAATSGFSQWAATTTGSFFGSTSNVLGGNSSTASSTGVSLFGTPSKSSSFGGFGAFEANNSSFSSGSTSDVFGRNNSTAPSAGAGFGSFGTFGANKSSFSSGSTSDVFGRNTSTASSTGVSSGSFGAFGVKKSTFGTVTSVGMVNQPTSRSGSLFSQSINTPFTELFGAAQTEEPVKFQAPVAQDTIVKTKWVNTRHQVISAMEQYNTKSIEELRIEDYSANRKGGSSTGIPAIGMTSRDNKPTGGLFEQGTIPTFSSFGTQSGPLFGGATSRAATTGSSTGLPIGQPSTGLTFGQPSTGLSFGQPSTAAPASTTASGLSFGSTAAQPAAAPTTGGFSFGGGASGGASGFSLSTTKPAAISGFSLAATTPATGTTGGLQLGSSLGASNGLQFGATTTTGQTTLAKQQATTGGLQLGAATTTTPAAPASRFQLGGGGWSD